MQRAAREDVCISSTGLGLMVITDLAFLLPAALKSNVIKHGVVGAGVSLLSLPGMPWWGWLFLLSSLSSGGQAQPGILRDALKGCRMYPCSTKAFPQKARPFLHLNTSISHLEDP